MINSLFRLRVLEEMECRGIEKNAELARLVNMTPQNLGTFLRGKRRYNQDDVEKISEGLNLKQYQLFLNRKDESLIDKERKEMREYQEMIEMMELIPFFRNQIMAKFEALRETHPDKIREAKKKGPVSSTSK